MFERFTDRARMVVVLARAEAVELGHSAIGTEHILLGMLRVGNEDAAFGVPARSLRNLAGNPGVAGAVLAEFGVTAQAVREKVAPEDSRPAAVDPASALAAIGIDLGAVTEAIEASFGKGALGGEPRMRFTPEARDVLRHSLEAALALRHRFIGTEHILLGVLRDREGLACETLAGLGVDLDGLADHVRRRVAPQQVRLDESTKRFNDLAERARASAAAGPARRARRLSRRCGPRRGGERSSARLTAWPRRCAPTGRARRPSGSWWLRRWWRACARRCGPSPRPPPGSPTDSTRHRSSWRRCCARQKRADPATPPAVRIKARSLLNGWWCLWRLTPGREACGRRGRPLLWTARQTAASRPRLATSLDASPRTWVSLPQVLSRVFR